MWDIQGTFGSTEDIKIKNRKFFADMVISYKALHMLLNRSVVKEFGFRTLHKKIRADGMRLIQMAGAMLLYPSILYLHSYHAGISYH